MKGFKRYYQDHASLYTSLLYLASFVDNFPPCSKCLRSQLLLKLCWGRPIASCPMVGVGSRKVSPTQTEQDYYTMGRNFLKEVILRTHLFPTFVESKNITLRYLFSNMACLEWVQVWRQWNNMVSDYRVTSEQSILFAKIIYV